MYATIRSYSGAAGLVDGLVPLGDDVRRALREVPGFQSYYFLRTGEQEAVSVTVCDGREGAEESSRLARDFIAERLPDLTIGAPVVSAGEVLVSA